ncbi:unnamed protein product [Lactuca virosa]|uniref:Auxin-responsive protein n=1 Tax=Lactuca virosa TaxID=75947 RepID=A0AAU9PAM5_9ASTR|nr:unnamed protein product [Lactuca virosa]
MDWSCLRGPTKELWWPTAMADVRWVLPDFHICHDNDDYEDVDEELKTPRGFYDTVGDKICLGETNYLMKLKEILQFMSRRPTALLFATPACRKLKGSDMKGILHKTLAQRAAMDRDSHYTQLRVIFGKDIMPQCGSQGAPASMFIGSCKRLKIMKGSDAIGLGGTKYTTCFICKEERYFS